ncbi:MAG: DUF5615 family PIN-like protein [Chloroflexota bacterium]
MLRLLLDENISHVVAEGLLARRPDVSITSVHHWQAGVLRGQPDHHVLRVAAEEGLTLVTYDLSTINPLIREWRALGISHGGVIFVPGRTIPSGDFGGLIRALEALWDEQRDILWTDRSEYLRPVQR